MTSAFELPRRHRCQSIDTVYRVSALSSFGFLPFGQTAAFSILGSSAAFAAPVTKGWFWVGKTDFGCVFRKV